MVYRNDTGLPSVTDVLSPFINSEWFTEESRDRGTAVHSACFSHITGGYVVPLPVAWSGYYDSFRRWCDMARLDPESAEVRMVDQEMGFCGQSDFVGYSEIRPGLGLIDWKTSLALEKWYKLQGAAYRHLARINHFGTEWGGNLRLKSDGKMPLFNYWPDHYPSDFLTFHCALTIYKFFQ